MMNKSYDVYMCSGRRNEIRMCDIRWINAGWTYGCKDSTPYNSFCRKARELGFYVPPDFEKVYDLYVEELIESRLINTHKQQKKKPSWIKGLINKFTSS